MKPWLALFLVVLMVLSLAGCSFSVGDVRKPGDDPGQDPGEAPGNDPAPEDTGEWKTVDGEFYTFSDTDLSFVVAFKELHFTYADESDNFTFMAQYLEDEEIEGTKTRHYRFNSTEYDGHAEFWFTEDGELVQAADSGGYLDSDPYFLEWLVGDWLHECCLNFLSQHCNYDGFHYGDIYTDPSVFAASDHDYQVREISTREADLGAGAVTIYCYDYSSAGSFDVLDEIAKIGEKYMFISHTITFEGGFTTKLTITKVIPF